MKLRTRHVSGEELQELQKKQTEDDPEYFSESDYILDDLLESDLDGIIVILDIPGYGLTTGERFSEFIQREEEKTIARLHGEENGDTNLY